MIPQGSTPTVILTFSDVDCTEAQKVYVTFNSGRRKLTKSTDDSVAVTATEISVYLSQAETLAFLTGTNSVEVQVNFMFADGSRAVSEIARFSVAKNLLDEVL